jgi:hypothetical protein
MSSGGVILGDWTHRRGDPGGTRSVSADVGKARPEIAWSWRPDHGGRVDQVRIAGTCVYVATMAPSDDAAPGWEHATIYALDVETGRVIASRMIPDPVPVAAMMALGGVVHVIATRKGEPISWYALTTADLTPMHRRIVELDRDGRREDVLDAWASPDGGVWLELEGIVGASGGRAYAFVGADESGATAQTHTDDVAAADWGAPARDACCGGRELYAPLAGSWREDAPNDATPPAIWMLEPRAATRGASGKTLAAPEKTTWSRSTVVGPCARLHAMFGEGAVSAIAVAEDVERPERAIVQTLVIDGASATVRHQSEPTRVSLRAPLADAARVVRRSSGELVLQTLQPDGLPSSDLVCARSDGGIDVVSLGSARLVLDAALGDVILAHDERKSGRVVLAAIAIDHEGRLLGRRSTPRWSVETEDLGGSTTIYAGAGHVVVRGARGVVGVRV